MKAIVQRFHKRNVYAKIMVSFALVLCIVSAVVLPFLYQSEAMLRQQHVEATLSRMAEYLNGFEREYQMVTAQTLNLYSEDELIALSQRTKIEYKWDVIVAIREVRRRIDQIADCSMYVDKITVYLPRQSREITTEFYYQPIEQELYQALLADSIGSQKRFISMGDRIYTCYALNSRRGSGKSNDFLIAIRWNTELIRAKLKELINSGEAGAAFIGNHFGGLSIDDRYEWQEAYRYGNMHILQGDTIVETDARKMRVFWMNSEELLTALVIHQDENRVFPWKSIFIWQNIVVFATIILSTLLFLIMMRKVLSVPLKTLKKSIRQSEQHLGLKSGGLEGDDFDLLFSSYQNLIAEAIQLKEENFRQQLLVKNAQLKQLQSQINPHFLFNSLLCASSLIKAGNENEAEEMLKHLSCYYEYLTREAADERTLLQEHMHIRDYIRVQSVRFGGRIQCRIDSPPEKHCELKMPRLTLQPIVENCFSHAFNHMAAGGILSIRYAEEDGMIRIVIENNGAIDDETIELLCRKPELYNNDTEASGLTNVHLRLRYRYGSMAGLSFKRGAMGGLEVTVNIPIEAGD